MTEKGKAAVRRDGSGGDGRGTGGATGVAVTQPWLALYTVSAEHMHTDSAGMCAEAVLAVWCMHGTEDTQLLYS